MNIRFLAATVLLLAIAVGCSSLKPGNTAKSEGEKDLKAAPEFSLKDSAGNTVKLSDYKGKVVLLDFWATWCGPCKIEIPWFIELQRKYKDQGFTVLGVAMDDDGWQVVRPFVDDMKMNYPVVLGNDETATSFGGVEVLPTTFIIDRKGDIIATHKGLVGLDEMENAIKKLL